MNPKISIITPTYNHEKYIEECIESVLEQTYENWEMIIIDDASTDKTFDLIKKYKKVDSRIKILRHKHNYGPLNLDKSYNEALSLAKGEWIAILEGDDVWPIYKLERQIYLINELPKDVVLLHGNVGLIFENKNNIYFTNTKYSLCKDPPMNIPYYAFEYLIYGCNPIKSQTVLIKKQALLNIGGFIQKPKKIRMVDFPTWLRLSQLGKFYYDPYILGFWRRHSNSITLNYKEQITMAYRQAILRVCKELNINYHSKKCLGIVSYFEAIIPAILNRQFDKAKVFLKRIKACLRYEELSFRLPAILRLLFYKLILEIKQPKILEIAYKLKEKKLSLYSYEYKPFFFKEKKFNETLNYINQKLSNFRNLPNNSTEC
jgi:glycosyltransferase involved in cell wall biosynthesis